MCRMQRILQKIRSVSPGRSRSASPVQIPEEVVAASKAAHLLLPSLNAIEQEREPYTSFHEILKENPEFKDILEELVRMLDLRTFELKLVVAKQFIKQWPQRSRDPVTGNERTQEQLMKLMKQPCFKIEIDNFVKDLPEQLEKDEEISNAPSPGGTMPMLTRNDALINIFFPIVEVTVSGMDNAFSNEVVFDEDGIAKSVKSVRALEKYARCGLRMPQAVIDGLNSEFQEEVKQIVQRYSGGRRHRRRKTKRVRKNRHMSKKRR